MDRSSVGQNDGWPRIFKGNEGGSMIAKNRNAMKFEAGDTGRKENDLYVAICSKMNISLGEIRAMIEKKKKKRPSLESAVGQVVL